MHARREPRLCPPARPTRAHRSRWHAPRLSAAERVAWDSRYRVDTHKPALEVPVACQDTVAVDSPDRDMVVEMDNWDRDWRVDNPGQDMVAIADNLQVAAEAAHTGDTVDLGESS